MIPAALCTALLYALAFAIAWADVRGARIRRERPASAALVPYGSGAGCKPAALRRHECSTHSCGTNNITPRRPVVGPQSRVFDSRRGDGETP